MFSCGQKKNGNTAQNYFEQDTIIAQNTIEQNSKIWVIEGDTLQIFFEKVEDFYEDAIENINVYFQRKLIYNDFELYSVAKDDVKFIKYNNTDYVLMMKYDMPAADKWLIFEIKNQKVKIHNNILRDILKDIDDDGIIEVGGSDITETICMDCDSMTYSPKLIYKLGNTLTFDSIISKKLTEEVYGNFLGYEYIDSIVFYNRKNYR